MTDGKSRTTTTEPNEDWQWDDDSICATCKGTGMIHPISAPPEHFVATYAECPHCEGTGRDI